MRSSARALFAGAVTAGLLVAGSSTAFAAKDDKKKSDDDTTQTAAAEGGDGGYAGDGGIAINFCPAIGVLAKAEANCSGGNGGNANGGDAEAYAEDDSRETHSSDDD
ncbi:hypothetical protein A8924_1790 [Saccharopolyspora erythraea NRRL 2338]|uniref:DUF320 domain-containing protein n=1 Tax=Saccharopolyspora erythraea TaxID=1836 RepID=A0ABN1C1L5_SACER|nr:hypothetical protein [Saccharopolyspora erythraea]EQD87346.1 hypothetical protein N599_04755 [Saccharopolyspora erythraea D]PFG94502.1 hypothetical protein A8924_1790 [Saccharopolyspora erythraea NRRL 2338]